MRPRLWVYLAIVLGLVFHAALLPYTVGQTYDSYIHMFFGDHYNRSWFDPWEPRWYTGFTVTAYPPGSHQILGLLIHIMEMKNAFIVAQLLAVVLLIIGVFRFSRLWVSAQASANAALIVAFSTSISETLHIFGQLPTTLSIALFLNATPHISAWIKDGNKRAILPALIFTSAATSVHHVTPIFGTIFFVAPLGVAAWLAEMREKPLPEFALKAHQNSEKHKLTKQDIWQWLQWAAPAPMRGIAIGMAMLCLIIVVVFPYWHWSITDPITQVSIPHGSRENFLKRPNLGIMFFVIPWGFLILALPFVVYKTATTTLWPLGLSVLVTFILGTGGTTPIAELILGPAFWILTLDRFTFWSSLLILPFAGLAAESLRVGRANQWLTQAFGIRMTRLSLGLFVSLFALASVFTALIPTFRPTQPDFVDPSPIATFMDEDEHFKWRYLTLGFGDQFAYHSAKINAESVDGNYHSARRLPALMQYSVERLENSKYSGVPGLASLGQFLVNAEKFNLKFVFSNDEFYDPLLHYTGWNPVTRLRNNVVVWEKNDISPLPPIRARRTLPRYQVLMWGTIPISALALAAILLTYLALRGRLLGDEPVKGAVDVTRPEPCVPRYRVWVLRGACVIFCLGGVLSAVKVFSLKNIPQTPEAVIQTYYGDIDFRKMRDAYNKLAPRKDLPFEAFIKEQRLTGGLLPSYGKLTDVYIGQALKTEEPIGRNQREKTITLPITLRYLTALGVKKVTRLTTLIKVPNGEWKILHKSNTKSLLDTVSLRGQAFEFIDLKTLRSTLSGSPNLEVIARPIFKVSDARLVYNDQRFYVVGEIENTSVFPACGKITSTALDENADPMLVQASGRIGAHRLLPGERSPFRIDFEGFMKISDSYLGDAFDPDQFSLPQFSAPPQSASLDVWGTVCATPRYKSIKIDRSQVVEIGDRQVLKLAVTNTGTKIVSTLQFKMGIYNPQGDLVWVDADYLQTNLLPGEKRELSLPLNAQAFTMQYGEVYPITVNGIAKPKERFEMRSELPMKDGYTLRLNYDAMVYEPLR